MTVSAETLVKKKGIITKTTDFTVDERSITFESEN